MHIHRPCNFEAMMEASQRDLVGGRYTTLHSLLLSAASTFLCTLLS